MVGAPLQTAHVALFLAALAAVAACLGWSLRNRDRRSIAEFTVFLAAVGLWSGVQLSETLLGPAGSRQVSFAVEGLRSLMAVSWFYFTLTYAGYRDLLYSTWVQVGCVGGFLCSLVFTALPPVATTYTFDRGVGGGVYGRRARWHHAALPADRNRRLPVRPRR